MPNTGKKSFSTLTQVYLDTGVATGTTKSNLNTDPDYIAPVVDETTCPPPAPPVTSINRIEVTVLNNSTQPFSLANFVVKAQGASDSVAYFSDSPLAMLPSTSRVSVIVEQLSSLLAVNFLSVSHALGIRMKIITSYKKASEGAYTIKNTTTFEQGALITLSSLSIPTEAGNGINRIKIEISNDPVVIIPNNPPIVNVGVDQVVNVDNISLTGIVSDSDGAIVSKTWSQISGPNSATIVSPTALTTSITGLILGSYVFRLTATDNLGGVSYDELTVTYSAPTDPNGIVNLLVDPSMPDNTFEITSVSLKPASGATLSNIFTTPKNKTHGVVVQSALKGTYQLILVVGGATAGTKSLRISWSGGAQLRLINLPGPGTYVFDDIVVDEGVNGVLINYYNAVQAEVTYEMVYAKMIQASPVVVNTNILPNGLNVNTTKLTTISFYLEAAGTTPKLFTGKYRYNREETDVLYTGVVNTPNEIIVTAANNTVFTASSDNKIYNYNLGSPLIEHKTATWAPIVGEGYLIIP